MTKFKRSSFKIYKQSGHPERFSRLKLQRSLERTGLPAHQCRKITSQVAQDIGEGTRTKEIYHKALRLVGENSRLAAVHYSLKRALFELGPSGHHFETFVSRYFSALGFDTHTCRTLPGKFVTHEVDVIVNRGKETYYVECKFHNRAGIKNDIKIALYVKARWDDLKEGPTGKSLTGFYLASNTAFSLDAVKYAAGTGLRLLGTNAPTEKPFLDQIKELNLYPITSLNRVKKSTRDTLLNKGIILASELLGQRPFLERIGLSADAIDTIFAEINLLMRKKL